MFNPDDIENIFKSFNKLNHSDKKEYIKKHITHMNIPYKKKLYYVSKIVEYCEHNINVNNIVEEKILKLYIIYLYSTDFRIFIKMQNKNDLKILLWEYELLSTCGIIDMFLNEIQDEFLDFLNILNNMIFDIKVNYEILYME